MNAHPPRPTSPNTSTSTALPASPANPAALPAAAPGRRSSTPPPSPAPPRRRGGDPRPRQPDLAALEPRIAARGERFFEGIRGEAPSVFNKARWTGKVLDWCMGSEAFKVQLLRFVDVFPALGSGRALTEHIEDYFARGEGGDIPALFRLGAKGAGLGGAVGSALLEKAIRHNIRDMARQFIVGETAAEAVKNIARLRRDGFATILDPLGEATVSEAEANAYRDATIALLHDLAAAGNRWQPLPAPVVPDSGGTGDSTGATLDWGCAPAVQVAVKPSALYSQVRPADFDGSVRGILRRLEPVLEAAAETGAALAVDMESHRYKDITLEVFRRLRATPRFRGYPHLCAVLQAYLVDAERDLADLIEWARAEDLPLSVRLVKGAYWDYETVVARQHGWKVPVWEQKHQTDACFERMAAAALENHDICHLACGSHNIRSAAAVMEMAEALDVPPDRYEFQVLYGMAEPVRKALLKEAGRVRLYCPFGEMVPGMAYLVRRLLENTANESFLRQTFAAGTDIGRLLASPHREPEKDAAGEREPDHPPAPPTPGFTNEPAIDFTDPEQRATIPDAVADLRNSGQLNRTYALHIGGEEVETGEFLDSVNPCRPAEVVGRVHLAGPAEVDAAIKAAAAAFPAWRDTPPAERASVLRRAADAARGRLPELAAWQVLEVGKNWGEAHADVAEAIDFLEYYAAEMLRLAVPRRMGDAPGEINTLFYEPRGVAAVIAPWNFPLAIACGMVAAAVVAGNTVVFKPSGLSPVNGRLLLELFRSAGLPAGVLNYLPGPGGTVGDALVDHPAVSTVAFTGSVGVGLRILGRAAVVQPGQAEVKRVIAEMGGKNAIIIDEDADLDEAVPAVLASAFGFQGQKCSACSRAIVLDAVYERFVQRLVEGARALRVGPAEDPANAVGAVIDRRALASIRGHAEAAVAAGADVLYQSDVPAPTGADSGAHTNGDSDSDADTDADRDGDSGSGSDAGFFHPVTILGGVGPGDVVAQEELFGPVLAVLRARDFGQALEWANATRFALTGGVFSRSPRNLDRARREFRVGNLYLNRGCTGALVGRQPFGGSKLSGLGTKAGGPDYLQHFLNPRAVTENTMRRGFDGGAGGAG